jgi:hypothetical protein
MRFAPLLLLLAGCDVGGSPCGGDLASACARDGLHCVQTWSEAADASTWCSARDVTNARSALQTCLGYHVVVATVNKTNPPTTVWYYYEPADGGLIGTTTRDDQFVMHCLAGEKTFRAPDDCATSQSPGCCRLDFGPEMACGKDAAAPMVKDASTE